MNLILIILLLLIVFGGGGGYYYGGPMVGGGIGGLVLIILVIWLIAGKTGISTHDKRNRTVLLSFGRRRFGVDACPTRDWLV